jgi:hypothetical protein
VSYQTGTSTGVVDLLNKLETFAVANGWISDESSAGRLAMHRSNVYVSFRWNVATPSVVGLYHALGWSVSTDPGNHPDDSGQGMISDVSGTLDNGRHVPLGTGAFSSYFFFESDTYIHIVVEVASGKFKHFGFGVIEKVGDNWTGGEYCYGHNHLDAGNASAVKTSTSVLLDGLTKSFTYRPQVASMHCEGLPSEPGSTKWGIVWGDNTTTGDDRGSNPRIYVQGGFRGGPVAQSMGHFSAGSESGLIPMYQITSFYRVGSEVFFLGTQPDVRGVNVKYLADAQEVVIGGDTWVMFPAHIKSNADSVGGTKNQGIAYKKVTT